MYRLTLINNFVYESKIKMINQFGTPKNNDLFSCYSRLYLRILQLIRLNKTRYVYLYTFIKTINKSKSESTVGYA